MKVENNKVALFHYTLSVENEEFSESSVADEPVACLIGHRNVLPAVESAMMGMAPGEEKSIRLSPEEGYGARREDAVQRVPIKHVLTKGRLKPGMVVKINTREGPRDATVVKVGKFNVDLDTNHPLAGKVLTFSLAIADVRDASPEEIAHGHAHGAGGHHH